jgi:tRNA(Ile)-lysidine synthase
LIREDIAEIASPVGLVIKKIKRPEEYRIPQDPRYGVFDADKISFPVELRKWRQGDRFIPLGMKGLKKLSDFFIDNKLSIPEKEDIWILVSGKNIIWIVNYRIDERVKVSNDTKNILLIEHRIEN